MGLGDYRRLEQLGAGRDGASFLAPDEGAGALEVRTLSAARELAPRWAWLSRRARLAAMVSHPRSVRPRDLDLDGDPPLFASDWHAGPTLAERFSASAERGPATALPVVLDIAGVLAAAHRVGLAHGSLAPWLVTVDGEGRPLLELTRAETRPAIEPPQGLDPADFLPPEGAEDSDLDPAVDVYALGTLAAWLLTGAVPRRPGRLAESGLGLIGGLLDSMREEDPGDRPTAAEVERALASWTGGASGGPTRGSVSDQEMLTIDAPSSLSFAARPTLGPGQRVGRYRIIEEVGRGGQGVVYRAEDTADGGIVALKVLRAEAAARPDVLRRFRKEARLLAAVNNPFVVNLLAHSDEGGVAYLAMEFVAGQSLSDLLIRSGRLDEPMALAVAADIARGLGDAHERGIVHRDVKPANVILTEGGGASLDGKGGAFRVKLTDFGLARNIVDTDSLAMTAPGALLGTPQYMPPEQFGGRPVDPRADVYALGGTLFHMLAGQPPFVADTLHELASLHANEPAPPLGRLNLETSEGVERVVARALAKDPADRYPDALAMLHDLDRLLRGEPTGDTAHPALPPHDPANVLTYMLRLELRSSPTALWPHVSDTERLNRAIGLQPPRLGPGFDGSDGPGRDASFRKLGMAFAWREFPFEWVQPSRFGVLRAFKTGPFRWLTSRVDMRPGPGGGTVLEHRLRVLPKGPLGRAAAALEVGFKSRRALERVYRRIDDAVSRGTTAPEQGGPFEPVAPLSTSRRKRMEARLDSLSAAGADPEVVASLGAFLARAPSQDVARLRPIALANRWRLPPDRVIDGFLHAVREGLLVPIWDVLCPSCRLPSEVHDTLRAVREHGRCDACRLEFENDFGASIELAFRAHPEVREADARLYCSGGPSHSPHVPAQVRVAPGERVELALGLREGTFRLRGPQLPWSVDFRVRTPPATRRWEVAIAAGVVPEPPVGGLQSGGQLIVLANETDREVLARVERTADRDDVLTAARASALPTFRALFPGEVLAPGRLAAVASMTVLAAGPAPEGVDAVARALGEGAAVGSVIDLLVDLDAAVRAGNGTTVKTGGESLLAVFAEMTDAVATAVAMAALKTSAAPSLMARVAVHRGPVVTATFGDRPDYFGPTVRQAIDLLATAEPGSVLVSRDVSADSGVDAWLRSRGIHGEVVPGALPTALRLVPRASDRVVPKV